MTTFVIPAATSRGGFRGWLRLPHQRWKPVIESDTQDDALGLLMEFAATVPGVHKDLTVLSHGIDPNHRRRRYARVTDSSIDFINAEEQTV
jgi:hypothetical protein